GATHGRFDVGAWGANTMRAEFAVLTGISEDRLGFDRFNPYHAFARTPLHSLASRLRAEGYRTLCLHPFDRSFFRRDLTLPALGFESFLGRETLGGSRRPPYRSDPDLARQVVKALDAAGPRTFIFVITMGNHGPWQEAGAPIAPGLRGLFDPAEVPEGGPLLRYLDGLAGSDEMLAILLDELGPRRRDALFGFYGDHLPSLPRAFAHFGFDDRASDYVLVDGAAACAQRFDLPAHRLPLLIFDRLRQRGAVECPRAAAAAAWLDTAGE
ncbi:MAG: LTA synthase family protein, partial [Stellaceae bacterium]